MTNDDDASRRCDAHQHAEDIGDLARGPGAERYTQLEDYSDTAIRIRRRAAIGTPDEIIARLKRLEAGGVENVLLVDPTGSIATLQIFAKEVMPAFAKKKPAPAKVI